MTWTLTSQIALLMVLATILTVSAHDWIVEKRREDGYKRKENGL